MNHGESLNLVEADVMNEERWPTITVVGAGAVGCYFGGLLARAGAPVSLVGRPTHVEAIHSRGLRLESIDFAGYISVTASTNMAVAEESDLVLLAVKTLDTETATRAIVPHLSPNTVLLSLQNGVDNVDRIRQATGIEAVATVVYVAAEMTGPGVVRHSGGGELVVGNLPGQHHALDPICAAFERARVPCLISGNIEGELWAKLVMNCAYNAVSALTRQKYGWLAADERIRPVILAAAEETIAVAESGGVRMDRRGNRMDRTDLLEAVVTLGERLMPEATSSTAHDLARGRKTEIDSLNGVVVERGAKLGVPTPVNQTLQALVKALEGKF
jgi:2-dehydropantoate 2-reductase